MNCGGRFFRSNYLTIAQEEHHSHQIEIIGNAHHDRYKYSNLHPEENVNEIKFPSKC